MRADKRPPRPELGGEDVSEELLGLNEACNRCLLFRLFFLGLGCRVRFFGYVI